MVSKLNLVVLRMLQQATHFMNDLLLFSVFYVTNNHELINIKEIRLNP